MSKSCSHPTARTANDHKSIEIYCDGACEPNPGKMGIGVYCEHPLIEIAESGGQGTNNVAECLAAIAALEEAKRRGLSGFVLFTDSQLVCNWTQGRYQCRSQTARRYVPEIQKLLKELRAEIRWCPGRTNPADALSRRHLAPVPQAKPTDPLRNIIETPMEQLRFRDFARLKVGGRDEYSRIRLPQLKEMVPESPAVEAALPEAKAVTSCLRWILRGLSLEKALRKVKTDLEIAENAKRRWK